MSITFFDRRAAFHSAMLGSSITSAHLTSQGIVPTQSALGRIASLVWQQASTLGFGDTMIGVAAVALLVVPLVIAFPRSKSGSGATAV
jgi:hypothetical protein